MLVICNINTGTTLILKTIINELNCNRSVRGRSQMTSCKNHEFLPPSLPSVIVHHDCLDPPPSEQKMTSSRPDPPSNFFNCFLHIIIFLSL